jgi:hypothetical protein
MYYNGSLATAEGSALVEPTVRKFSCGIIMADTFHTITPQMFRHITEDTEVYSHVWPASRCTYGSSGHVAKEYVTQNN